MLTVLLIAMLLTTLSGLRYTTTKTSRWSARRFSSVSSDIDAKRRVVFLGTPSVAAKSLEILYQVNPSMHPPFLHHLPT